MKLTMARRQEKSMLSVHFIVRFKIELTQEEEQLVKKYNADTLVIGEIKELWQGRQLFEFRKGVEFDGNDVRKSMIIEEKVKHDCNELKEMLQAADTYRGNEEFTF